jgi:5'-nucleotidase
VRWKVATALVLLSSCSPPGAGGGPLPERLELVLLHTADTHSQIFPSSSLIGRADAERGLGAYATVATTGGFARLSTILRGGRLLAERTLHLDSGDLFQGSLAFERFGGEPEILAFDAMGVDAQVLGNHELDRGAGLVEERYTRLAAFPLLAANYVADSRSGIASVLEPFVVLDAGGLRVAVIGVANTKSVRELDGRPNALGVLAVDAATRTQAWVDELRPVVSSSAFVTDD